LIKEKGFSILYYRALKKE